jgi:hypothetical protein
MFQEFFEKMLRKRYFQMNQHGFYLSNATFGSNNALECGIFNRV